MPPETPVSPFLDKPSGRDGSGRFAAGNMCALKTGEFSEQIRAVALESSEAVAALARRREAITADLGGDLSTIRADLVERYVQIAALADHFVGTLIAEGPKTLSGRTRQALTTFLALADRQRKLGELLALERRAKKAPTVQELLGDLREERRS